MKSGRKALLKDAFRSSLVTKIILFLTSFYIVNKTCVESGIQNVLIQTTHGQLWCTLQILLFQIHSMFYKSNFYQSNPVYTLFFCIHPNICRWQNLDSSTLQASHPSSGLSKRTSSDGTIKQCLFTGLYSGYYFPIKYEMYFIDCQLQNGRNVNYTG